VTVHRLARAVLMALTAGCTVTAPAQTPPRAQASAPPPAPPAASSPRPVEIAASGQLIQGGWARGSVPAGTASLTLDGAPVGIASDGRFLVAFDRDAAASATLVARLGDGRTLTRTLGIARRDWQIEQINAPRRGGGPTEDFMAVRRPELARINAARQIVTSAQGWRQDFMWPVRGRISGRFGSQRIYRGEPGAYHSGVDIATGESGTPFVAPADGVVILAAQSPFTLEGNLLMIDHGNGLNSAFLHCSQLLVKEGDEVRQGQLIGRLGMTGRATGPHLHWSMKWGSSRLDPMLFAGTMR